MNYQNIGHENIGRISGMKLKYVTFLTYYSGYIQPVN